jgi:hypothetical protein
MSGVIPDVWLSIPLAIFYLLTGDLEQTRQFPGDDPHFLLYRVARALSPEPVFVPIDSSATEEQRTEARKTLMTKLAGQTARAEVYGAALKALRQILADGIAKTKGSRSPDGPIELIDPAEFTRMRLATVHAINETTEKIVWYDLRISARDLLAFRQSIRAGGATDPAEAPSENTEHNGPAQARSWQNPKWKRARDVAMEWLVDHGCPVRGDGNQAELERHIGKWLDERRDEASESTIRRHVTRWIAERWEELQPKA